MSSYGIKYISKGTNKGEKKPFNNFGVTFKTNCVIRTGNA
jgi:hypothetical protein